MKKSILALGKILNKAEQSQINGGSDLCAACHRESGGLLSPGCESCIGVMRVSFE